MNFDLIKSHYCEQKWSLHFVCWQRKKYSIHRSACNKTKHAIYCFQNFYCNVTLNIFPKKLYTEWSFYLYVYSFSDHCWRGKGGAGIYQWSGHLQIKHFFAWWKKSQHCFNPALNKILCFLPYLNTSGKAKITDQIFVFLCIFTQVFLDFTKMLPSFAIKYRQ